MNNPETQHTGNKIQNEDTQKISNKTPAQIPRKTDGKPRRSRMVSSSCFVILHSPCYT